MKEYHKIQTVWERDPDNHHKTLLEGKWARPEFAYLQGLTWVWTEKVDGTNIRIDWDGERVIFGGRTDKAQLPTFLMERLQEHFTAERLAAGLKGPCTLYGEGYGARIQKGGGNYIPDGVDFILFDVWAECWLERGTVHEIAKDLDIKTVPITAYGSLQAAIDDTQTGVPSAWGDFIMEGFVMRPETELLDRMGRRLITKIKHKDFAAQAVV